MNTKQKTRVMRRLVRAYNLTERKGIDRDLMMDGSGDCAGMIYEGFARARRKWEEKTLKALQLTRMEYLLELNKYLPIEVKHARYDCPISYYDGLTYFEDDVL